jgi:hypothetical protein
MKTFRHLFTAYPIRTAIAQHLSAFEAAKLDAVLGGLFSAAEKHKYLHLGRDLFWNFSAVQDLMSRGLRLIFFGQDVAALQKRLDQPCKSSRSNSRLRIYLIGLFPLIDQRNAILGDVLTLSIEQEPSLFRIMNDGYEFARLRDRFERDPWISNATKQFIISFSAPMAPPRRVERRQSPWHKVSSCPESTIDLRVYVPSYRDRKYDNVRMSRGSLRRRSLMPGADSVV